MVREGNNVLDENVILFQKKDILSGMVRVPDWFHEEYKIYTKNVEDEKFPCFFATQAELKGDVFYTYVEEDWSVAVKSLENFLKVVDRENIYEQNLIMFFKPEIEEKNVEYYRQKTWDILNYLHEHDEIKWPSNVPVDKEDPQWGYCFGGEELFITSCFPALKKRRSRNLGNSLSLVIQPNSIFDGIESHTPKGKGIRQFIRNRLNDWDDISQHPDLSSLGSIQDFRWRNYVYDDENKSPVGECPFKSMLKI